MSRKTPITVDDLWKMERVGAPSVSPDEIGRAAWRERVCLYV